MSLARKKTLWSLAFLVGASLALQAQTQTAPQPAQPSPAASAAAVGAKADSAVSNVKSVRNDAGAPAAKTAAVAPATQVKDLPYARFKGIADKNIFNPYRVGRSAKSSTPEALPTGDHIALVGTMSYGKGVFAFFDSNLQVLRQVVPEGGQLGDFKVNHISATGAQLVQATQTFSLTVSQQLTRPPEGGAWTLTTASLSAPGSSPTATENAAGPTDSAPAIPADASDVLKRLMEKRQKQLKE